MLGDGEAGPPGEAHDPPLEGCPLGESLQRLEGRILRPDVQEVAFVDVKPLRRRSDRSIHVTLLIQEFSPDFQIRKTVTAPCGAGEGRARR